MRSRAGRPHDLAVSGKADPRRAYIETLFARFDAILRQSGYIAMSGQIVDASLIAAPRQRNTEEENKAISERRVPEEWKDKPAKLRHKDRDARWTVKFTKAKPREDGSTPLDLTIPVFGYQNHISIDCEFGLIRRWSATDAAAYEGARLREGLLDTTTTASPISADTAYRSKANEEFMEKNGFVSRVHRKKPKGRVMPEATRRANNAKSKIRSRVMRMFSPPRKIGWTCSSAPSGLRARRRRSDWRTSFTTSNDCSFCGAPHTHNRRCGSKRRRRDQRDRSPAYRLQGFTVLAASAR